MPWLVTTGPPIVEVPVFVVAFMTVSLALGHRLLRLLGADSIARPGAGLERGVVSVTLGAGALVLVPYALGAGHVLSVVSLRVALIVVAVLTLPELRRLQAPRWERPDGYTLATLAVLAPVVAVTALLALTPTLDADGLGYHLTVPKRWLESGTLGYLPTYAYSNTPMGVEMLFMSALAFVGDAGAKGVHFALTLTGAVASYAAGRRIRGRGLATAALVVYLVGPAGVGSLMGWAYLEGATACALVSSALAWLVWQKERDVGWLRCAALLAGIAVSFKITAALFPVALAALTVTTFATDRSARLHPKDAASAALLSLVPVLPWLARSALMTGNPVFPLFARWIPSRDLSAANAERFESYNRYMLWASRFGGHWSLAERKLILAGVGACFVAGAAVAFWRVRTAFARSLAVIVGVTLLVQLAAVGLYVRYWVPMLAVLELPLLAWFGSTLEKPWARAAVVPVALLATVQQVRGGLSSADGDFGGLVRTALGLEDQTSFLEKHVPLLPIYRYANESLPPSAHVMLSSYCSAFYLDRSTYCAEVIQDALRFTSWEAFIADVRTLRIGYVVAPLSLGEGRGGPGPGGGSVGDIFRNEQNEFVGRLLTSRGLLLAKASDQGLYSITP